MNNIVYTPEEYKEVFDEKYLKNIRTTIKTANKKRVLNKDYVLFNSKSNLVSARDISLKDTNAFVTNSYKNSYILASNLYELLNNVTDASISYQVNILLDKNSIKEDYAYPQTLSNQFVYLKASRYGISDVFDYDVMDKYFENEYSYFVNLSSLVDAFNSLGLSANLYYEDLEKYEKVLVKNTLELDELTIKGVKVFLEVKNINKVRVIK